MTEADRIIQAVCEAADVTISQLVSDRRARSIARPRQLAMTLIRQRTSLSLPQIGRKLGNRDHTTVLHADRAWQQAIARGEPGMADIEARVRAALDEVPEPEAEPETYPEPVLGIAAKRVLQAAYQAGAWATRTQIADAAGLTDEQVSCALTQLARAGHVRREPSKRPHWTAIRDVAGYPRTPLRDARYGLHKIAKRQCNRCRNTFQPESRYNYRCRACDSTVKQSPEYGAAPGMEFIA